MSDLPKSWTTAPLRHLGRWQGGGTPSKAVPEFWKGSIPWVSPKDMKASLVRDSLDHISEAATLRSAATLIPERSILVVTRSGILAHSLPVAINAVEVTVNQDLKALTPGDGLSSDYLAYALKANERKILDECVKDGTTVHSVEVPSLLDFEIPVAPTREQHRIVAKIEELFSEIDKAVESLTLARAQLKTYRQALLKAAFDGKLTADWRAANEDKLEPPEALLARIRAERDARYEQALTEWKKQGAIGRPPKRPVLFEPTDNEGSNGPLPTASDGWSLMRIGDLFDVCIGATPSRKIAEYWGGSINWVSSGEVQFCTIASTKERITEAGFKSISADMHPAGTVMLGMIGEGKTRGQAAILMTPATHNQNCAAIRVAGSPVPSAYVYRFLQYMYESTRRVGSGNNQKALNKERIQNMTIPIAPPLEMERVAQELEASLSQINAIEDDIDAATAKTSALRQSILKKAFSGQLVAQNPADEPAAELLERIWTSERVQVIPRRKRVSHA